MQTSQTKIMPAVFIGHGSPMNALEDNRFSRAWAELANRIAKPRAILAISAHWYIDYLAVTAMRRPKTIHDFYGFPPALAQFSYPAPGEPELAEKVLELLKPAQVKLDQESWGLDHGTWSVLARMYPDADVPVVQLAINANLSFEEHLQLGKQLAGLRQEGVLILASGNVVHNLGMMRQTHYPWAIEFDDEVQRIMSDNPQDLTNIASHLAYRLAAPTPEHFIPLLYIAGLAAISEKRPEVMTNEIAMGSITMTSFVIIE